MKKLICMLFGLLLTTLPLASQELSDGASQLVLEIVDGVLTINRLGGGGGPSSDTLQDVTARGNTTTNSIKIGVGNVATNYSFAQGMGNVATGLCSQAQGLTNVASGRASHAEGNNTVASGNFAHSEGADTTASGYMAHAEGTNTTASGKAAHAEGFVTTASGQQAHAEGYNTIASGTNSHAAGVNAVASDTAAYVWASSSSSTNGSHGTETFNVYAANGIYLDGIVNVTSNIIPTSSNTLNLGSLAAPFRRLYVGGQTIYMDGVPMLSVSNGQLVVAYPIVTSNGTVYTAITNIFLGAGTTGLVYSTVADIGNLLRGDGSWQPDGAPNAALTNSDNTYAAGTVQYMPNVNISGTFALQQGSPQLIISNSTADQIIIGPGSAGRGTNSTIIGFRALTEFPLDITGKAAITAIGHEAGRYVTNSIASVFIGFNAGYAACNSKNSIMIGDAAGAHAQGQTMTLLGAEAGEYAVDSGGSYMCGFDTGRNASNSPYSEFAGYAAGYNAYNSVAAALHGNGAGYNANNSSYLQAYGYAAAHEASNSSYAIMIGERAGYNASNSAYSVFIGNQAGRDISRPYTLIVDGNLAHSRDTNALLYGEFDNQFLKVNGNLEATGTVTASGFVEGSTSLAGKYARLGANNTYAPDFTNNFDWLLFNNLVGNTASVANAAFATGTVTKTAVDDIDIVNRLAMTNYAAGFIKLPDVTNVMSARTITINGQAGTLSSNNTYTVNNVPEATNATSAGTAVAATNLAAGGTVGATTLAGTITGAGQAVNALGTVGMTNLTVKSNLAVNGWISNDGGNDGIYVTAAGQVCINTNAALTDGTPSTVPALTLKSPGTFGQSLFDSITATNNPYGPSFRGWFSRGTFLAPSAALADDFLFNLAGQGFGTTVWQMGKANIFLKCAENWTDSATGSRIVFATTPTQSTTRADSVYIQPNGCLNYVPKATFPPTPVAGDTMYHSVSNVTYTWNGSLWKAHF